MGAAFLADVHVPAQVILQLRLRGVDISAATEEGHERLQDADLRDPFDRMLIAQALSENLAVVGNDEAFDACGVERIW